MTRRMHLKILYAIILFIALASLQSDASLIERIRELAQGDNSTPSPSPNPALSVNTSLSGAAVNNSVEATHSKAQVPSSSPTPQPSVSVHMENCEAMTNLCHDLKNMTACIPQAGIGPDGSFLVVENGGENLIKLKVSILPVNIIYKEANVAAHNVLKIDVSSDVRGNSSIILNAGNGDCIIHLVTPVPEGYLYKQFPSYAAYVTPVNGAYLLFATLVIIGGAWTCCSLGRRGRKHDGVAYQELEMGQRESPSSTHVETAEGWDQDWDDDWDEEKAVKPSGGNHVRSGLTNGHISRSSDIDGWGNDWDD